MLDYINLDHKNADKLNYKSSHRYDQSWSNAGVNPINEIQFSLMSKFPLWCVTSIKTISLLLWSKLT